MWPRDSIARDAAAFDSTPLVNRDPLSGEGAPCGVPLGSENDSGVVAEVTLVCVAMSEVPGNLPMGQPKESSVLAERGNQ